MGAFDVDRRPDSRISRYGPLYHPRSFAMSHHGNCHKNSKRGCVMNVVKADLRDFPKPAATERLDARTTKRWLGHEGFKPVKVDSNDYNHMLARRGGTLGAGKYARQTVINAAGGPTTRAPTVTGTSSHANGSVNQFVHY